jgi:hypothetical protein
MTSRTREVAIANRSGERWEHPAPAAETNG